VVLNKKDIGEIFGKLDNGALIIEKASCILCNVLALIKSIKESSSSIISISTSPLFILKRF